MEQPKAANFKKGKTAVLSMGQAIKLAKAEMAAINDLPIDQVIRSERGDDGGWTILLEVIESPARMGENDFLAAFALTLDPTGALAGIERVSRYRREDGGGSPGR